jgi:hypothetical protein
MPFAEISYAISASKAEMRWKRQASAEMEAISISDKQA